MIARALEQARIADEIADLFAAIGEREASSAFGARSDWLHSLAARLQYRTGRAAR